jgi:hypothetical protein
MTWHLIVSTVHGEHRLFIGASDEARSALADVRACLGTTGPVEIAGRLTLRAEDITAAQIFERHLEAIPRRRAR